MLVLVFILAGCVATQEPTDSYLIFTIAALDQCNNKSDNLIPRSINLFSPSKPTHSPRNTPSTNENVERPLQVRPIIRSCGYFHSGLHGLGIIPHVSNLQVESVVLHSILDRLYW